MAENPENVGLYQVRLSRREREPQALMGRDPSLFPDFDFILNKFDCPGQSSARMPLLF
jgi:hypothetical protein